MGKLKDLTGRRFHFLTVLHRAENTPQGKAQWLCRCVCGKEVVIPSKSLQSWRKPQKSCGCMRGRLVSAAKTRHGMSHHPAFGVWHSMKQRCMDPNHRAYHNYGGRGITVCDRWKDSFENFWKDMGPTWKKGLDLDRIDNDAGYSPENCHWTTRRENCLNRRKTKVVDTPLGKLPVSVASEIAGIGKTTLVYRADHGWPAESMFTKPDTRNRCTTSGIVVRGTDSRSGTGIASAS